MWNNVFLWCESFWWKNNSKFKIWKIDKFRSAKSSGAAMTALNLDLETKWDCSLIRSEKIRRNRKSPLAQRNDISPANNKNVDYWFFLIFIDILVLFINPQLIITFHFRYNLKMTGLMLISWILAQKFILFVDCRCLYCIYFDLVQFSISLNFIRFQLNHDQPNCYIQNVPPTYYDYIL